MSESSTSGLQGDKSKVYEDIETLLIGLPLLAAIGGLVSWACGRGFAIGASVAGGLVLLVFAVHFLVVVTRLRWTEKAVPDRSPPSSEPRNHIICLDGTWNYPEVSTNVRLLWEYLDRTKQHVRYYPGVGTRENRGVGASFLGKEFSTKALAGVTARGAYGVWSILAEAYFNFVRDYKAGDRIFIFGFSRGAATARALANFICTTHGLPRSVEIDYLKMWTEKNVVMDLRVTGKLEGGPPCDVEMLGLWDTVAAVGQPHRPYQKREGFDLSIPARVKRVHHLVAIHEQRKAFQVVLIDQDPRVDEIWFAGAHANVGGGLPDPRLSDLTLRYMVRQAKEVGILFEKDLPEVPCDPQGKWKGAIWQPPWYFRLKGPRKVQVQNAAPGTEPRIHESVLILRAAGIESGLRITPDFGPAE